MFNCIYSVIIALLLFVSSTIDTVLSLTRYTMDSRELNVSLLSDPLTPVDNRGIFSFNIPELSNIAPYNPSSTLLTPLATPFCSVPAISVFRPVSLPIIFREKRRIVNCFPPTIIDPDPDHTLKVRPFSIKIESRQDETPSSELFKKPAAKKRSMDLGQTRKIRSRRRNRLMVQMKKCSNRIKMRLSTLRQHNKTDEMNRRRKHYFL